jgi:hypothetical protein
MMIFDALHPKTYMETKSKTRMGLQQLKYAAKASHNLGLNAHATLAVLCYGNIFTLGLSDLLV